MPTSGYYMHNMVQMDSMAATTLPKCHLRGNLLLFLKDNAMKNLKKLKNKQLKSINGGNDYTCPDFLVTTCAGWCGLTPWQQQFCMNAVEEPMPCNC